MVTSIVNNYLTQHDSAISCIDFTLNTDFDLVISHLCIDSLYAEIELIDTLVKWRLGSSYLAANKIADAISVITIASVNVRAKADISLPVSSTTGNINEFPAQISQLLNNIAQFTVPVDIDIQAFSYQAFTDQNNQQQSSYQGRLSATAEQLKLSLANQAQQNVFSFELAKKKQGFNANLTTDLTKLAAFLSLHPSALPPELAKLLVKRENDVWSVKGEFNSQIDWHKQTLKMTNTLNNLSVWAEQGFIPSGLVKIDATLAWKLYLAADNLQLDFAKKSAIKLVFEQRNLTTFLSAQVNEKQLKKFITDNAMNAVTLEPLGSIKVDFNQQKIASDGVALVSTNLSEPLTLSFNDIALNYTDEPRKSVNLQKAQFSLTGQAKITQLQPYSKHPVKLHIAGEFIQHNDFWQVKVAQETAIELTKLSLPASQLQQVKSKAKPKSKPRAKSLISHWQGSVTIAKHDHQTQGNNNTGVTFNLEINNQISQLNYPNVIQVNTLELTSKLSGSIDNIAINTKVIADHLLLASVKVTGGLRHPNLDVSAKDVLITDLLALKIKVPIELQLIDGTLSYHFSGQLKNTEELMANPMSFTVSVQDLTGDVDGTWLQELNWQQEFIVQNGQVKSLTTDSKGNVKALNNLTIAKIETAIPITQLSTNTLIGFSEGEINLVAKNTRGYLLDGRFDIVQVQWPFSKDSAMNVKLTEIDLEKLLELDRKQGIVVTGKVSGQLPIYYDGEHLLMKEGNVHNIGEGLIQVFNNPAVEELKASSTELKLAFSALENLHYHHLASEISMDDDGYMLLVTEIKGRNPDLDNEVNLNLNLSYDLLGLLESLNITEHFENKVIKGLQP